MRERASRFGLVLLALVASLLAATVSPPRAGAAVRPQAFVPDPLLAAAKANPQQTFKVIVQGRGATGSGAVADQVGAEVTATPGRGDRLKRRFRSIAAVSADLTGRQIVRLARRADILAITRDAPLVASDALPLPPANTLAPLVTGSPVAGETLTATPGTWNGDAPVAFAYRWQRCDALGTGCADIGGAGAVGYALTVADVGATVRAVVTATNLAGSDEAASLPTAPVAPAPAAPPPPPPLPAEPPVAVSAPAITGTAAPGGTLTVSDGTWTSTAAPSFAYRWQRCDAYPAAVLGDGPVAYWRLDDAGANVLHDASGNGIDATGSAAVAATTNGALADTDIGAATLDGTGAISVAGLGNDAFASGFSVEAWVKPASVQVDRGIVGKWQYPAGGLLLWIDGTGRYSLGVTEDSDAYLRSAVPATVGSWQHLVGTWNGSELRLYVNGTLVGSRPFAGLPGGPQAGFRIGGYGPGGYDFDGSLDEVAFYSRALSDADVQAHASAAAAACVDIAGAGAATYDVTAADAHARLRALVTATTPAGSASATSVRVTAVAPVRPASITAPGIAGTREEDAPLAAVEGGWGGTAPLAYSYAWQRCDADGTSCVDIPGATNSLYVLTEADVGERVRLRVTAANGGGATTAISPASAPVAEARALSRFSSRQLWPYVSGTAHSWPLAAGSGPPAPAIAIVDSGIDATRPDFGTRVLQQVTITTRQPNAVGDGRGHGTFVASIAAGGATGYTGATPGANLVGVDVMDDTGAASTSDLLAAADWIYQNKDVYGIRVANFSMQGSVQGSFRFDPVNKAVEKLWLGGIVVVAAAGNYAQNGQVSQVRYAPGNDPFVITVGATDTLDTLDHADDVAAPWSAYGHTPDGFAKPEIAAPGRYMIGAVPPGSTLAQERPDHVVVPGYMELSGTSFSAPIVAGAAAYLLQIHPGWTPDQVKGALMAGAAALPAAASGSVGLGELDAPAAAAVTNPPNPNLPLEQFLVADPAGGSVPVFDAAGWAAVVDADPNWATGYWGSGYWGSGYWGSSYWDSGYWGSGYWGSGYWGSDAGGSSSNNAANDAAVGGYRIKPTDRAMAETALGLTPAP